jgi:hypothetical protein
MTRPNLNFIGDPETALARGESPVLEDSNSACLEENGDADQLSELIGNATNRFFLLERVSSLFRMVEQELAGSPLPADLRSTVLLGIDALTDTCNDLGEALGKVEIWELHHRDQIRKVSA